MNEGQQPSPPTGRFKNILLATDGSEFSRSAEMLTAAFLLRFGGRVTVMQVVLFDPGLEPLAFELVQQQEKITRQSLDEVKERMKQQGISCNLLIKHGQNPHQEILDAAVETHADLVVMGRRGRRGLARMMLGDTAARIVAQSPRTVLVVPRAGGSLWNTSILLATDGSPFSDRASAEATILAKESGLPLRVVSVVENKGNPSHFEAAGAAVERAVEHAKKSGVTVQGAVLEGHPPADIIADEAYNSQAGLVVGGSHGRTGFGRVFIGSVMERLLGKVSCPVLVVKGE